MKIKILAVTLALFAAGLVQSAHADPIITNGGFESSSYTHNNQFGTGYGGQGVTGWTGGGGYQLYFVGNTGATNSAASEYDSGYNTGSEKFYTIPGSPAGGNYVALDGDATVGGGGSISQTINSLTVGQQYQVSFTWGAGQLQSRSGATLQDMMVSLGNQSFSTASVSVASGGFSGWLTQTFIFTATSASEALTFLAQGTPTGLPPIAALDGVSMVAVPEPGSIALLGGGLALLGLIAYRRRQTAV